MQLEKLITGPGRYQVAVPNKSRAEDLGDGYGINDPRSICRPKVVVPRLLRLLGETGLELDSHQIAKGSL